MDLGPQLTGAEKVVGLANGNRLPKGWGGGDKDSQRVKRKPGPRVTAAKGVNQSRLQSRQPKRKHGPTPTVLRAGYKAGSQGTSWLENMDLRQQYLEQATKPAARAPAG